MCERKIWKQQDDEILKELFEVRKIRKWSEIARIMQEQFGIGARNGKQCRERYHNHLRRGINKDKWTRPEELQLIDLHAQHGNRWALISKQIPGRTENCVKNMLYSKLRKAIRQLNRFLFLHHRRDVKEIKLNFIYRLIEFTENAYKREPEQRNQMELLAIRLKNEILKAEMDEGKEMTPEERGELRVLVEEIHAFKRKNQRFRGNLSGAGKPKPKPKNSQPTSNHSALAPHLKLEETLDAESDNRIPEDEKLTPCSSMAHLTNQVSLRTAPSTPCLGEGSGRLGIQKMESLESNFSFHFGEAGLEMPIQVQAFAALDPAGIFEEWGDLGNVFSPNFYY